MAATLNPIGVIPQELWQEKVTEERVRVLLSAMHRYAEADCPIPQKWLCELCDHLSFLTGKSYGKIAPEST